MTEQKLLWKSGNGRWEIYSFINPYGVLRIMVVDDRTGYCDYPIMYDDGGIAYDFPERIPKYVREKVRKIMWEMRENGLK